jgi:transcriptional regulator with GAF, ATPase, and Fis domain
LESELFGYEKGAFTDAKRDKPGQFALATGSTLLLDEISETDVALQAKLPRVQNNGEYQPRLRIDADIVVDVYYTYREGQGRQAAGFTLSRSEQNVDARGGAL